MEYAIKINSEKRFRSRNFLELDLLLSNFSAINRVFIKPDDDNKGIQ